MQAPILFSDFIAETKDGEWGEGQEAPGHVLCDVIRGTDFADLHAPGIELPQRWIPEHLVARKALQADDILIETAGGTAKQSTGRTALITKEFLASRGNRPVLCSSFARHLRVDADKVHPVYLYYVLQALYASGYMGVFNLQHTGVARFQFTAFRTKTRLTLHDKAALSKIAAALKCYDDLIANNQRRIALLESMAEEIYREWFVRMRFPMGVEHEHQTQMELTPLEELGSFLNGYPFDPSELHEEGLPIIKIRELNAGVSPDTPRNTGDKIPDRYKFSDGDIVFSWSGSLVVQIWHQGPALLNQHLFKVTPAKGVPREFLYFSIKFAIPIFESLTTGATMQHIKRKELRFVKVRVPSPRVMTAFDNLVSPLMEQALRLKQISVRLKAQRDALLPRLISGKLRVDALDIQFPPSMQPPAEETAQTTSIRLGLVHSGA